MGTSSPTINKQQLGGGGGGGHVGYRSPLSSTRGCLTRCSVLILFVTSCAQQTYKQLLLYTVHTCMKYAPPYSIYVTSSARHTQHGLWPAREHGGLTILCACCCLQRVTVATVNSLSYNMAVCELAIRCAGPFKLR